MPPATMRMTPAMGSRLLAVVPSVPEEGVLFVLLPIGVTAVSDALAAGLTVMAAEVAFGKVGGALVGAVSALLAVRAGAEVVLFSVLSGAGVGVAVGVLGTAVPPARVVVAVALATGSGVTVQPETGVGFQAAPGVAVLPLIGGGDTRGTLPVKPCTCTVKLATQPWPPSAS